MTYSELINNLEQGVNFSWSRFGDGEFNCMYGKKGCNCDGHIYFDTLARRLTKAWNDPRGVVAVQLLARQIHNILGDYPDADILHKASIDGKLHYLLTALEGRNIILVGPDHLKSMEFDRFIAVRTKNAWMEYPNTLEEVNRLVQPNDVVLLCCGMMAEVLIWDMYSEDITMIDCGSVFDPYCGVKSRKYHHKL